MIDLVWVAAEIVRATDQGPAIGRVLVIAQVAAIDLSDQGRVIDPVRGIGLEVTDRELVTGPASATVLVEVIDQGSAIDQGSVIDQEVVTDLIDRTDLESEIDLGIVLAAIDLIDRVIDPAWCGRLVIDRALTGRRATGRLFAPIDHTAVGTTVVGGAGTIGDTRGIVAVGR